MKRKLVMTLLTLTFTLCSIFGLTACGHECKFDQQIANQTYIANNATCTEKPKYFYSCKCGKKGTETFEHGEKLEHLFTNYVYNNDATCLENGTETATCDRDNCNETNKRVKEDSAGHTYSNKGECICGEKADIILFDGTAPLFSVGKANCLVMENCPENLSATFYFYNESGVEVLVEVSVFDENDNVVIPKKQNVTSIELNFVQGKSYYIVVIPTEDAYMSAWKPQ
jgi:hypothetical protein